jgi:hypothetical protein
VRRDWAPGIIVPDPFAEQVAAGRSNPGRAVLPALHGIVPESRATMKFMGLGRTVDYAGSFLQETADRPFATTVVSETATFYQDYYCLFPF